MESRTALSKTSHADSSGKLGGKLAAKPVPAPVALETEEAPPVAAATDRSFAGVRLFGSDPPPPPAPPTPAGISAPSVIRRMEAAFGLGFAGVRIHTDETAATRASGLGARAWTDGREIGFARSCFAPDTRDGLRTLAHEFAHVAQARAAGGHGHSGFASEVLESNARESADAVLTGHRPLIVPGEFGIARDTGGEISGAGPKAKNVQPQGGNPPASKLPEGVSYQVSGWTITVSVKWLKDKGWSGTAGNFKSTDAISELVRATAAARGFSWITEEALAAEVPNLFLRIPDPGKSESIDVNMTRMLAFFGPPPDMEIFWMRSGESMTLVFRTDLVLGTNPTKVNGAWLVTNPALNERIAATLETKTGLSLLPKMRAAIIASQIELTNLDKGTIMSFPRARMEEFFGKEAWQSYLDKPEGTGKAGAAGGEPGGKAGGVKGGLNPNGDPAAVERVRKVYDFLKEKYPDQLKDKSFEDFVAWLQKQQAPSGPSKPDQDIDLSDAAKWRGFVEKFVAGQQLPVSEDGKVTGVVPDQNKFEPAGEMVLSPELPERRYVVGSSLEASMNMGPQPADNVLINAFPNKANFHWSVDGPEQGVDEGLLPDQGTGAISHSIKFLKPGVFVINVSVTSEHFRGSAALFKSRSVTVINPAERLEEVFTGMAKGQSGPSLFDIGPDGKLRVKEFAKGLTFAQQKAAIRDQIATINDLVKQKKFTQAEADEAIDLLDDRLDKLNQFQTEIGNAGRPYVAQGVFLSEVHAESWPLKLTMYDSVKKTGDTISYTVMIADLTSVSSAPRYTATVEVPVGTDENAAMKKAERDAITAACAALSSQNDYPDGHIKLAVQLHESAPEIVTPVIDTRNTRKTAKAAAGYGGMILGGVGLVAGAVFTEGTTTPVWVKVIVVSAALAGVVQAGVSIEQRVRTGQFGDDWTVEAVDILQIATSLASVGTMPFKTVPGGIQLSIKVAEKSQLVFLAGSTKGEIDRANKEYQLDLTQGMKKEDAEKKRDAAIAGILQGAAMTGGFLLMAHVLHGGSGGGPGAPPAGEEVSSALHKLAYEGTTADIKTKMAEKNLAPEDRRFLSDMLDWRATHGKPVAQAEVKPGEPVKPVVPDPVTPEKPATRLRTGETAKPVVPEPKTPENPAAKPEPRAPSPDVDPYPASLAHVVDNVAEAHASYHQSISVDPNREVAIYHDRVSGEYLVVQGEHTSVPTDFASEPGMERVWTLEEHYHPGTDPHAKLASVEDYHALMHNQIHGLEPPGSVSTKIRYTDPATGKPTLTTEIGYDPHAEKPYWMTYLDSDGKPQTKRFEDTPWNANSDYIRFLQAEGVPQETIPGKSGSASGSPGPAVVPAPAAPPVAAAPAAPLPKFKPAQRVRMDAIAEKLNAHGLRWEDVGIADRDSAIKFFAGYSNLDDAMQVLETRLNRALDIKGAHAADQRPEGFPSRKTDEAPAKKGPDVPEGQRMPRETEKPEKDYGGFWGGVRGNSPWYSDVEELNKVTGYKPVEFHNGYADFSPWAEERVTMKITGDDDKDFPVADDLVFRNRGFPNKTAFGDWRSANRKTWHHVEGSSEMILVPRDLHENVPHVGGASQARATAAAAAAAAPVPAPPVPKPSAP